MQQISLDIHAERVARMLQVPADNSRDFRRSWDVILDEFERMVGDQFATRGSALGTPWDDKADGTPATLHDTGALEESFTRGGAGHVRNVDGDSAEWGSDLETPTGGWVLGELHQGGTSRMPARTIFVLNERQQNRVVEVLAEGLFRSDRYGVRAPSGRFAALGF